MAYQVYALVKTCTWVVLGLVWWVKGKKICSLGGKDNRECIWGLFFFFFFFEELGRVAVDSWVGAMSSEGLGTWVQALSQWAACSCYRYVSLSSCVLEPQKIKMSARNSNQWWFFSSSLSFFCFYFF